LLVSALLLLYESVALGKEALKDCSYTVVVPSKKCVLRRENTTKTPKSIFIY